MQPHPLHLGPVDFGALVATAKATILEIFVDRVRVEVPGARGESRSYLEDHLGQVLDELGAFLSSNGAPVDMVESARFADAHGRQRARGAHYTLEDLRHEYRVLRTILFSLIPADHVLSTRASLLFGEVYDLCVSRSTEVFVRNSAAELATARALARERQNLEEVLEQTAVPTALLSGPDHVFRFANSAYRRTFAFEDNIIGSPVADVVPESVAQGFVKLLDGVYATGVPFVGRDVLFERPLPDGSTGRFHLDFTFAAKRGDDGAVEGVLATAVDVTDRVQLRQQLETANEALRAEKFNLDQIVQTSPAAMATWVGPDLVFERVNMEYANIFGGRPLLGRPLLEACPELAGQGFDELLRGVLATGEPVVGKEQLARISPAPGAPLEDRYYDYKFVRLKDEQGRPFGVFDFAVDVTRRVLADRARTESEGKLRSAEHLLQRALQVAELGFYTWDMRTDEMTLSQRMQEQWGLSPGLTLDEIMGHIHPDDRERVAAGRALSSDGRARFSDEFRVCRPDGRVVWVAVSREVVVDDSGASRAIGISLDITARKESEEALRTATLEAKNANIAKSAFLANMSHEIRTPLGAIMGFSELLRNPELTSSELLNFVAVIDRNSQHLLRIVDDILDLSKVEAGKMLFEHIEFSLPVLVSDFASLMSYRAREKGIEFSVRFDSEVPDLVLSDPTRLRQVLTNVVGNAIKFTERGSVELGVRFDRTKLTFAVSDTGRGLTTDQASRLFHAFVQADESTTRKFGGTGLGLVLTKRIASAMGGDFVLERSEPGVGSTFVASLAVALPPHATLSHPSSRHLEHDEARAVDKRRLAGLRVLVVDDSPDNRTLLGTLLHRSGAVVESAVDGAEGVAMALSKHYDAVLMDIQMPRLDGYQALERLRAEAYAAPIIALTAHAMVEERERAEGKGFAAFLTKPIRSESLLALLDGIKKGSAAERPVAPLQRLALLVEDDDDIRMLLASIMQKQGFEVAVAADGAQALLALANGRPPALVLLDLTLPDISGADVVKAVRADARLAATKIVVVSGWDDLAKKAREMGADESLQKPIELPRLKAILAEMFASA